MLRFRWPFAVLTALYCTGIYRLSAQSDLLDDTPSWLEQAGVDKLAHAIVFGGLGGLVHQGLVRSNAALGPRMRWALPLAFTVLYGLSDEIHQRFVPNRHFDLLDLLADGVGALAVVALLEWRQQAAGRMPG